MFQHDFATVQRVLLVEPGYGQALSALFASVCLRVDFHLALYYLYHAKRYNDNG